MVLYCTTRKAYREGSEISVDYGGRVAEIAPRLRRDCAEIAPRWSRDDAERSRRGGAGRPLAAASHATASYPRRAHPRLCAGCRRLVFARLRLLKTPRHAGALQGASERSFEPRGGGRGLRGRREGARGRRVCIPNGRAGTPRGAALTTLPPHRTSGAPLSCRCRRTRCARAIVRARAGRSCRAGTTRTCTS